MADLELRPAYWASVSGGKDSLYMLMLILAHPEQYPLDGVVHFELEIDFPFVKDVVDKMEAMCKQVGVKFVRVKPRKTWQELYEKYGFPTRVARWCNKEYKLDAKKQLNEWMRSLGRYVVWYIGYCADEEKRFSKRKNVKEVYPLVDFGIKEDTILEWAKTVPEFNDYYKTNRRCGCMYCPMMTHLTKAYLYKHYPDCFWDFMAKAKATEKARLEKHGQKVSVFSGNPKYDVDYIINIVQTKWLPILEEMEADE